MFWYTRGHVREGRDWLVAVLERASPAASARHAGALDWAGYLSNELGEDARGRLEQAVACAREADAAAALALALSHLPIALANGDERIAVLQNALSIAEQAGDPRGASARRASCSARRSLELEIASLPQARVTLQGLAAVAAASGDRDRAARLAAAAELNASGGMFLGPAAEAAFERHSPLHVRSQIQPSVTRRGPPAPH